MGTENRLIRPARMEHLEELIDFISSHAREAGLSSKIIGKIELAAEEALVNIIHYAYPDAAGNIEVRCRWNPPVFEITFKDWGIPFDPITRPDPDTHLSLSERRIGGMGILLIKKMIPELRYRRENGANILTFDVYEGKEQVKET